MTTTVMRCARALASGLGLCVCMAAPVAQAMAVAGGAGEPGRRQAAATPPPAATHAAAASPTLDLVAARLDASQPWRQGEFVLTETGLEGSLIYTLVPALRAQIAAQGEATLWLDLLPDRSLARVQAELARPRGGRSMANHLRVRLGLDGPKAALLRECAAPDVFSNPDRLAEAIKSLRVRLFQCRPIDEAISTAGGVSRAGLDEGLMLWALPGVFCAGEMLDWEAPTGGYLLTASLATGLAAGQGALAWLVRKSSQ